MWMNTAEQFGLKCYVTLAWRTFNVTGAKIVWKRQTIDRHQIIVALELNTDGDRTAAFSDAFKGCGDCALPVTSLRVDDTIGIGDRVIVMAHSRRHFAPQTPSTICRSVLSRQSSCVDWPARPVVRHLNERLDACMARVCDATTGWNAPTPVHRDAARIWSSVDRDGKNIDRPAAMTELVVSVHFLSLVQSPLNAEGLVLNYCDEDTRTFSLTCPPRTFSPKTPSLTNSYSI